MNPERKITEDFLNECWENGLSKGQIEMLLKEYFEVPVKSNTVGNFFKMMGKDMKNKPRTKSDDNWKLVNGEFVQADPDKVVLESISVAVGDKEWELVDSEDTPVTPEPEIEEGEDTQEELTTDPAEAPGFEGI